LDVGDPHPELFCELGKRQLLRLAHRREDPILQGLDRLGTEEIPGPGGAEGEDLLAARRGVSGQRGAEGLTPRAERSVGDPAREREQRLVDQRLRIHDRVHFFELGGGVGRVEADDESGEQS
jgi:hypothetical protein